MKPRRRQLELERKAEDEPTGCGPALFMLKPHELAAAQGFLPTYKFTGTQKDVTTQIGNAVPRRLARALCLAAISQQSNVSELLSEEEAA